MNFTNLFNNKIETASQTVSAINCFSEYVSSKFNSLANFMAGDGQYSSAYFYNSGNTVLNRLGLISQEMYNQACEQPDYEFMVPVKDAAIDGRSEDFIKVTGRDITDAFEQQLSELRCQEQYLSYCMNVDNCTSTDFLSRMRSLCPNIAGAVIDKFSSLIEISGSPIDCLKNFFSLFKPNSIQYTNQVISLVDYTEYVGNIWQSAWQTVNDTVDSFFDGVWQGIQDLEGFFNRLLGAIVQLGKWIISKAFAELNTYYDKGSSAVAGIMDLPLFQVYGLPNEWREYFTSLNSRGIKGYSWDNYNHKIEYDQYFSGVLMPSLSNLIRDEFDGVTYQSVCEVVVPSTPYDISIRVGETSQGQIVLNAYVISDYGSWSKYSDQENYNRIWTSLRKALMFISQLCPIITTKQNVDDTSVKWTEITEMILEHEDPVTKELVQCLTLGSKSIAHSSITNSAQYSQLISSILIYTMLMSKGFVNTAGLNNTNYVLTNYIFSSERNLYTPTQIESDYIVELDHTGIDLNILNATTFRPYSKRNQLPVTVHYQTSSERGEEILNAILKMVIAVVAVVATIKLVKWTKKRNQNTMLAHAKVEKLAWDVASSPTNDNISLFNKAWNKAQRMDFMNGILGLSTGLGTGTVASAFGTVSNIVGSSASYTRTSASNSNVIIRNVDNVNTTVHQVKSLIRS